MLSWNRFHWWSVFFVFFKKIPILATVLLSYGHIHIDNYGHFSVWNGHIMAMIMANIGIILKSTKNADHPWKRFQKRINLTKVMAKTSHGEKLWPFPMYFEPISGQKYGFQRQHFPCELRADLYVFGIRGTRGMGAASELIQNQTF